MSEHVNTECKDPAGHHMHICTLREQGRQKDVAALMTDPGYTCLNCNAVAHNIKNLCNPSSFSKA